MNKAEMHRIPALEVATPTGQRVHTFPLVAHSDIILTVPRNNPVFVTEKVSREFFGVDTVDYSLADLCVSPCLIGGAVDLGYDYKVIIIKAPTKEPG